MFQNIIYRLNELFKEFKEKNNTRNTFLFIKKENIIISVLTNIPIRTINTFKCVSFRVKVS